MAVKLFGAAFCVASVVLGILFHFVTRQPMPWWPDTAIIGAFVGFLVALIVVKAVLIDWPFNRAMVHLARVVTHALKHR